MAASVTAPRQVSAQEWARMSWHARRAYERRGGTPPPGCSTEDRARARLAAAGVDPDAVEVVLGHAPPTYLHRRVDLHSWLEDSVAARRYKEQVYAAGQRHLTHGDP
jgi:hypothetical protein